MTTMMFVVGYILIAMIWAEAFSRLLLEVIGEDVSKPFAFWQIWPEVDGIDQEDQDFARDKRAILLATWFLWPLSIPLCLSAALIAAMMYVAVLVVLALDSAGQIKTTAKRA